MPSHVGRRERRTILSRLRIAAVENGRVTRVEGTVRDVSERERIQLELDRPRQILEPSAPGGQVPPMWMIPWTRVSGTEERRRTRRQA